MDTNLESRRMSLVSLLRLSSCYDRSCPKGTRGGHPCAAAPGPARILPWGKHEAERLNVQNGLCLSRLHDAAFDNWLISFDENLRLLLSPRLKTELPQRTVAENFGAFAGEPLKLPDDAVLPEPKFLAVHRAVFLQIR